MPTYDNMIPQPTDILSDSQDDILQNFQQLATAFAVNHGAYNSGNPPQGTHTQVTLPVNAAPTPTAINTANIFSQTSAITTNTELAWQRASAGSIIEFTGFFAATNQGWTRLPSGVLIKWGTFNTTANPTVVVFPIVDGIGNPIPPFTNSVYNLQLTQQSITNLPIIVGVVAASRTTLQFQANTFLSNTGAFNASTVFYLAIGI